MQPFLLSESTRNILSFFVFSNRFEKLVLQCGPRTKLVVTENWIVLIGMTGLKFARQVDSELLVCKENTHYIVRTTNTTDDFHDSVNSTGITQYLDIQVKCTRNSRPFIVRYLFFVLQSLMNTQLMERVVT